MALLEEKRDMFTNLKWNVSIEGLDDFYAQETTPPEMSYSEIEIGASGTNPNYKKSGKRTVGDWELVIGVPTEGVTSIVDWHKAGDSQTRVGQIRLRDSNDDAKLLYEMVDVWCKQLTPSGLTRTGDGELHTFTMQLSLRDIEIKQL